MGPERTVYMKFGVDFFKILQLVVSFIRMFARIFGDEEDKKADDETQTNCKNELNDLMPK